MTQETDYIYLKKTIKTPTWSEQYKEEYNKQTLQQIEAEKDKQNTEELIIKLNEEINKQSQELRKLTYDEGAAVSKIKKELYKDSKSKDDNFALKMITILQVIVLITLLLAIFNVMNKLVLTIVVVFIYIIVILVIFVKINKDKGRDSFNYNEFKIEVKPGGVCSFKPPSQK